MITIRKSDERGAFDHGWLDTKHTFSFGHYDDPLWRGFRSLRVINEDVIAPKMGFGEHPHRDMEIITYPVHGVVRHRDSLGHEEDITPGMIQAMTAGSGIRHSEFNPRSDKTHMLQIWIEPSESRLEPAHRSESFPIHQERGTLHLLASPDGESGALTINQDARMSAGVFEAGTSETFAIGPGRHAWIQIVKGSIQIEGSRLGAGDGAAISEASSVTLSFETQSEIILFDLA